jgi:hypothetical protein
VDFFVTEAERGLDTVGVLFRGGDDAFWLLGLAAAAASCSSLVRYRQA